MLTPLRTLLIVSAFCLAFLPVKADAQERTVIPDFEFTHPGFTQAQSTGKDWAFEVGVGAMYAPRYEGSDRYRVVALPNISVDYRKGLFFANMWNGIGSYPIVGQNFKVGASVGFAMGRKEKDDRRHLRGMGKVDNSVTGNVMGEYNFGPLQLSGKVSKGNSDYGLTANVKAGTMVPLNEHLRFIASVGTTWANSDHMGSFFGVTPEQAARSGYKRYHAGSGFKSVGVSVGAFYKFNERWNAKLTATGNQLLGDAADSPITKKKFNPAVFITTGYSF